jgi:ABC-type transporter Mla MlaB component
MSFRVRRGPTRMDAPRESPVVRCDVSQAEPDATTVDALARMLLSARRCGYSLRLCNASPQLLELIDFMGLSEAFAVSAQARR